MENLRFKMECNYNKKKKRQGIVKSNLPNKTITVEVVRTVKHIKYGKYIKKHTRYHVHDEFFKVEP